MKKAMIEQLVLGMVGTNTWLIKNKESNELLIIDPADESARIEEKIARWEEYRWPGSPDTRTF